MLSKGVESAFISTINSDAHSNRGRSLSVTATCGFALCVRLNTRRVFRTNLCCPWRLCENPTFIDVSQRTLRLNDLDMFCGLQGFYSASNGTLHVIPVTATPPRSPGTTEPKRSAYTAGNGRAFAGASQSRNK